MIITSFPILLPFFLKVALSIPNPQSPSLSVRNPYNACGHPSPPHDPHNFEHDEGYKGHRVPYDQTYRLFAQATHHMQALAAEHPQNIFTKFEYGMNNVYLEFYRVIPPRGLPLETPLTNEGVRYGLWYMCQLWARSVDVDTGFASKLLIRGRGYNDKDSCILVAHLHSWGWGEVGTNGTLRISGIDGN